MMISDGDDDDDDVVDDDDEPGQWVGEQGRRQRPQQQPGLDQSGLVPDDDHHDHHDHDDRDDLMMMTTMIYLAHQIVPGEGILVPHLR